MALIVEDGTGKIDAESYLSLATAQTYHVNHHNHDWFDATDDDKEKSLRVAAQYVDAKFGDRWRGTRTKTDQRLDWPRVGVETPDGDLYDSDAIPRPLEEAVAELSISSLTEDLHSDVTRPGSILKEAIRVGPISETVEYGSASQQKVFVQAEVLLERLLEPLGKLRRA